MTYTFKLSRRLASNYTEWLASKPTRSTATKYTEWLSMAALAIVLTACGANTGTGPTNGNTPTPGWLTVQLTTPNVNDGAVQLRVTGPTIDTIAADSRYEGISQASSGRADLILTGNIIGGTVAKFRVPDIDRAASYSVQVVAAAQRSTWALRSNTSSYRAVIVR